MFEHEDWIPLDSGYIAVLGPKEILHLVWSDSTDSDGVPTTASISVEHYKEGKRTILFSQSEYYNWSGYGLPKRVFKLWQAWMESSPKNILETYTRNTNGDIQPG